MANTPIILQDVILIDLGDVSSLVGGVGNCEGCSANSTLSQQMTDEAYATVSKNNNKLFYSTATASFKGDKILPGSIQIKCTANSDKRPVCETDDIIGIMEDIQKFYDKYKAQNAPSLNGDLKFQIGAAMLQYYSIQSIRNKCEDAMWSTFPTRVYQEKQFGPILEKWTNLRYPASNYRGNVAYPFLPYLNMVMKPYLTICPDKGKISMKVTYKSGETAVFCKSAVILVNPKQDWGYTIQNIVDLQDLETSAIQNWGNLLSPTYVQPAYNLMQEAMASKNMQPIPYAPAGASGPKICFRLSDSKTQLFGVQISVPFGAGPEFGQNWFYTPVVYFTLSPNAWATTYNAYKQSLAAQRTAAEAQRAANLTAITTPNPPVPAAPTPTTPVFIDPTAPVIVPPTAPVNPNITNPVNNAASDGTVSQGGSLSDLL